jgi:hypothetical protein
MAFYANLAATALRLLTKYGQTVVCTRTDGATYVPATQSYTGGSTTTITGKGAVFPFNKSEINGELIQTGDLIVFFEASSTAPAVDDKCTVDSVDYRVMSVEPLNPGGTVVMYTLHLRI